MGMRLGHQLQVYGSVNPCLCASCGETPHGADVPYHAPAQVRDVMASPVICVDINAKLQECADTLQQRSISWVVVQDPSAAEPSAPLKAYVGLISEAEIFLRLDGDCSGHGIRSPCREARQVQQQQEPPPLHLESPAAVPVPASEASSSSRQHSDNLVGVSSALSSPGAARRLDLGPLQHPQLHVASSACSHGSVASVASGATMSSHPSQPASEAAYSFSDKFSAAAALWELDFSEIELQRRIGEGSFGEVLLGSFRGTKVGGMCTC